MPTLEGDRAMVLAARTEGIVLDPVYTAKALAGLVDIVARGGLGPDEVPVFLHTGGSPIVFAYHEEMMGAIRRSP